jgi:L-phenylalanine/L-methionine N-acetyltransferase
MKKSHTTSFIPGAPVVQFQTKDGRDVLVRYPKWEDLVQLQEFINTLSSEDTYISFSGEQLSLEDEADFLLNWFKRMEFGDGVYLVCEHREKIIGACGIERVDADRARGEHLGSFGLSIAQEFRGQGVGESLSNAVLEEAKMRMDNLRIVKLTVFTENTPAVSLYKKLGFIEYGKIPGAVLYKGEYQSRTEMYLEVEEE